VLVAVSMGLGKDTRGKMSEEVNRKCPDRNSTVQLSTAYTDHERHNVQTDRQTDDDTMPRTDQTACSSTIVSKH